MYNDFKERKKVYSFTNNINNNNNNVINTKTNKNNKMCASGILPSWCNELHHKFTSTSNIPRYFRLICIFTATSAFILGIVIGLMIPIYFLPNTNNSSLKRINNNNNVNNNTSATSSLSQIQVPYIEPIPPVIENFDTVSFVPSIQRPSSSIYLTSSQTEYKKEIINSSLIQNGIYWSDKIESMIPYGYDSNSATDWRKFVRQTKVIKIEEGCGRMQNRLLTFDNGSLSCCRYRQNIDQIQGEIFSFYLGRYILNLPNLTPATLSRVKPTTRQWSSVKSQLSVAQWASEDRAVVMTKFIPNLGPSYIPTFLRPSERRLHPPDLNNSTNGELNLIELAQWSDLIIFDYLTANLDRVVNNLYNLQWNPTMMQAPAHNLAQDTTSGLLLFLDNESGLLHGYRLLEKYEHFHRAMLDALCIFRKSTANIIKKLHEKNNIGELLRTSFKNSDPEFIDILPMLPEKSVKILNKRIARVYEQISKCESLYQSS